MNNLASYFTNFTILIKKVLYVIDSLFPQIRVLLGCGERAYLGNNTFSSIGMDDIYKTIGKLISSCSTLGKTALVEKRAPTDVKAPMLLEVSLLLSRFFLALGDTLETTSVLSFLSALTKLWVIVLSLSPVWAEHFMATFYSAAWMNKSSGRLAGSLAFTGKQIDIWCSPGRNVAQWEWMSLWDSQKI